MHDPRAYQGAALAYAVGPRGACHLKGAFYSLDAPGNGVGLSLGITFSEKNDPSQKGALTAKLLQFCELYNSFTLCQFSPLPASMIARIMTDITGTDFKTMDLLTFGERSLNLKRAINNKLGVTCADDSGEWINPESKKVNSFCRRSLFLACFYARYSMIMAGKNRF